MRYERSHFSSIGCRQGTGGGGVCVRWNPRASQQNLRKRNLPIRTRHEHDDLQYPYSVTSSSAMLQAKLILNESKSDQFRSCTQIMLLSFIAVAFGGAPSPFTFTLGNAAEPGMVVRMKASHFLSFESID